MGVLAVTLNPKDGKLLILRHGNLGPDRVEFAQINSLDTGPALLRKKIISEKDIPCGIIPAVIIDHISFSASDSGESWILSIIELGKCFLSGRPGSVLFCLKQDIADSGNRPVHFLPDNQNSVLAIYDYVRILRIRRSDGKIDGF